MEADRVWYRPKFNIPFFCPWLPEFCLHDMRDPRSYFMFFFIFLKTIFLSLFHELLPRLRPYSVDESLTKLPTDDELCYFYFLSCYLALAQMHGTLPYYLFSS